MVWAWITSKVASPWDKVLLVSRSVYSKVVADGMLVLYLTSMVDSVELESEMSSIFGSSEPVLKEKSFDLASGPTRPFDLTWK